MTDPCNLTPLESQKRDLLRQRKPLVYAKVMQFAERAARGECVAPIQLQYSYRCNMRCEHCSIDGFRGGDPERLLTPDAVLSLCDQADAMGLAQLSLSGGEPLTFPDLAAVLTAIGPRRFYIQVDTNGWQLDATKAMLLARLGVDKIQVSLDSLHPDEHDAFRRSKGAHRRAVEALANAVDAGMAVTIATVVTPDRAHSPEWLAFLDWAKARRYPVNFLWPRPQGEWSGRTDLLPTAADIAHMDELARRYTLYDHRSKHFGVDCGGCLAARRTLAVTAYGDVLPCSWIPLSLGSMWQETLQTIIERGLRYFPMGHKMCRINTTEFQQEVLSKTWGKKLPVPIAEVMGPMGGEL